MIMKKSLLGIFLLFSISMANSQNNKMLFSEPLKNLGNAFYEVIYQYTAIDPDTNEDNPPVQTKDMALLIGKNFSQFLEYQGIKYDSLCNANAGKYMNMFESMALIQTDNANLSKSYIIKDHHRQDSIRVLNSLTSISDPKDHNGFVKYDSFYEDAIPNVDWDITDQTKIIGGIEATKAVGRLRGREWTAWFAESLPYPEGPWELSGLPGLILEAYDSEHEHEFTLSQLLPVDKPMFDRSEKYEKTTRKAFRKYRKDKIDAEYSGWKSGVWPLYPPFRNFIDLE